MNTLIRTSILFGSCFLSSSAVFSASPQLFNGVYWGGEAGASQVSSNQSIHHTNTLSLAPFFSSEQPYSLYASKVHNSAIGALFAGYGRVVDKFYLGGEVVLSNSDYSMNISSTAGRVQTLGSLVAISSNESITTQASISATQPGLLLRPGVMLTPSSLLYGRFGASLATVRYHTQTAVVKSLTVQSPQSLILPITLQSQKTQQRAAFQAGVGMEQAVTDALTVRLDYLYSYYGTLRATANNANLFTLDSSGFRLTASGSDSISFNTQAIMLGLAYHLNT